MEYIRLTVEGPIAVVTIHRPACRNALNSQVYREIIAALQDVRDWDDVRVFLLTGAGDKAFAAGADIAQMVQESPQSGRRLSALCHEAAELLETMRQVTIAAVNGYAKNPHELGKYLAIFLGVSVFILAGTEHSIADMYYWAVSGELLAAPGKSLLYLVVISLGNVVGGVFFPLLEKLYGKLSAE